MWPRSAYVCCVYKCTCNKLVCCSCALSGKKKLSKIECERERTVSSTFMLQLSNIQHTHTLHTHTNIMTTNFSYRIFFPFCCSPSLCVCAIRLCVSFAHSYMVRFNVGHPMKTVLFLALDRPTVSALTYQSSYSGKTYAIQQLFSFLLLASYSKRYMFYCSILTFTQHTHTHLTLLSVVAQHMKSFFF